MQGELAATAVNAPMVPAEVLRELQPFVSLAEGLGRAAVQLVSSGGFTDVHITYATPRGDELDTRLLRAMVVKGILEQITTSTVNLVNADVLARARGLRIIESTVPVSGKVGSGPSCAGTDMCMRLQAVPVCSASDARALLRPHQLPPSPMCALRKHQPCPGNAAGPWAAMSAVYDPSGLDRSA